MATFTFTSSSSSLLLHQKNISSQQQQQQHHHKFSFISLHRSLRPNPRLKSPSVVFASSSPFDHLDSEFTDSHSDEFSKKSNLWNLIQEIEPLDVSLIQKEVPPTTVDAMKRTISGMLGLLPSDHFQVFIEALWEPLSKLLVSSMMTGYTLRNAEFRLCLERNLDMQVEDRKSAGNTKLERYLDKLEHMIETGQISKICGMDNLPSNLEKLSKIQSENIDTEGPGELTPEDQYILSLQSRLSFVKKELYEEKRKNAALQMQQFAGEEKNDLLDYLRSLQPEQVVELAEPTSPQVKKIIHFVVHGLLATLSPRMHSKALSENPSTGPVNHGNEDCTEIVENTSLNFQPLLSLSRDYLARLLFWCMLLGHHIRGLEYRTELTSLLLLSSSSSENDVQGKEVV